VPAAVAVASSLRKMTSVSHDRQTQGILCGYCVLFVALCTLSGMLGIWKQSSEMAQLWVSGVGEIARWIAGNARPDASFTGNCSKTLFLAVLTGRTVSWVNDAEHFDLPDIEFGTEPPLPHHRVPCSTNALRPDCRFG
jgi:hypothetical protein